MSETLTMNEAPADQPEFNADEQDSLAVAESLGEEQPLLAGKFKDQQSLEKAYLELQQKLGEPREEVEPQEEGEPEEQEPEDQTEEEEAPESEQLTQEQANQLFEMVGGEQAYKAMLGWASSNLSKEEIQMYDSVMDTGNPNAIFFAVQALNNKYTDSVGSDGELLTGKGTANKTQAFRSQQELVQAMSDPRYDRDPAYRQEVIQKLENSDIQF